MKRLLHRGSIGFTAGSIGGLANSLMVWFFGLLGITTVLGVKIAPQLTPSWLYPRIVWGGLWGLLFLFSQAKFNIWLKGLLIGLAPTLVQLFIVFPLKAQKGLMGIELGVLTPLFVVVFNTAWGITTAWWFQLMLDKE